MKNVSTLVGCLAIIFSLSFTSCSSSGKLMSSQNHPDRTTDLAGKLKKSIADSLFSLRDDQSGSVYVSIDGGMLFNPGSAQVNKEGERALRPLGKLLYSADENFSIMIKSGNDSQELVPAKLVNNFALIEARANTVMRILTESTMQLHQKASRKVKDGKNDSTITEEVEQTQETDTPDQNGKKYVLVLLNSL